MRRPCAFAEGLGKIRLHARPDFKRFNAFDWTRAFQCWLLSKGWGKKHLSARVFGQRHVIGVLVNRQMMFGLRRMQSYNAVRPNYWGRVYVLWKQSGCAASATLGFIFLPTGFLSHNALNHSIYFLWQGWFVWMKFLVKFKARVRGLRASWGRRDGQILKSDGFLYFPLVLPADKIVDPSAETWPSGRRRSPAKGVGPEGSRGFESLRLRHHPSIDI